jgi:FG-GAP-like repeat
MDDGVTEHPLAGLRREARAGHEGGRMRCPGSRGTGRFAAGRPPPCRHHEAREAAPAPPAPRLSTRAVRAAHLWSILLGALVALVGMLHGAGTEAVLAQTAVCFTGPTNFPVGTQPPSAAVGDFNGDGHSDLAVANENSNNVSILLGAGTGSFTGPTNFPVGTTPFSVAVGDFNGDGRLDLAVANTGSETISILLNCTQAPTNTPTATATGTVTPTATGTAIPTVTATAIPTCILGDINCDGIVDIRDYGIWRQNFGATDCGNRADLDNNCLVDIRDYGIWRANFGHTAGAAPRATLSASPPPGTATPMPHAGRPPASREPGSAWGGILQAVQALASLARKA